MTEDLEQFFTNVEKLNDIQVTLGRLIEPAPGLVVIQVETKQETTASGLHIPVDVAKSVHEQRPVQGTVIAVGDHDEDDDLADPDDNPTWRLNLGDQVIFGRYSGTRVEWIPPGKRKDDRQICVVMRASDILGKLRTPDQAKNLKVRA